MKLFKSNHLAPFIGAVCFGAIVGSVSLVAAEREKRCFGTEIADLELVSITADGEAVDVGDYAPTGTTYDVVGAGYDDEIHVTVSDAGGNQLFSIRGVRK